MLICWTNWNGWLHLCSTIDPMHYMHGYLKFGEQNVGMMLALIGWMNKGWNKSNKTLNQSLNYNNLVTSNHSVMDDKLDPMKYNIST